MPIDAMPIDVGDDYRENCNCVGCSRIRILVLQGQESTEPESDYGRFLTPERERLLFREVVPPEVRPSRELLARLAVALHDYDDDTLRLLRRIENSGARITLRRGGYRTVYLGDCLDWYQDCDFCGPGWRASGSHSTSNCPVQRECAVCHRSHHRDVPLCVRCRQCSAVHRGPECCTIDTALVQCAQCSGLHEPPDCAAALSRYRDCDCQAHRERYDQAMGRRDRYPRTGIQDWNYRPPPVFRGTDSPVFLGMELELEVRSTDSDRSGYMDSLDYDDSGEPDVDEIVNLAESLFGAPVYYKHDGSIDYGFELVTHPMTYAYFMDHFPWEAFAQLREAGCVTRGGLGIHVHVSRTGLDGAGHTYKWMKLWYRNRPNIIQIARRTSDQWAAFNPEMRYRVKDHCKGPLADPYGSANRYSALNVQNPHTIEARVFRSSLNPRKIKAALGLVDATVEYTRQLTIPTIHAGGWDWDPFTQWATEQGDRYTDLLWLNSQGR